LNNSRRKEKEFYRIQSTSRICKVHDPLVGNMVTRIPQESYR
jgi:hypothetical protein